MSGLSPQASDILERRKSRCHEIDTDDLSDTNGQRPGEGNGGEQNHAVKKPRLTPTDHNPADTTRGALVAPLRHKTTGLPGASSTSAVQMSPGKEHQQSPAAVFPFPHQAGGYPLVLGQKNLMPGCVAERSSLPIASSILSKTQQSPADPGETATPTAQTTPSLSRTNNVPTHGDPGQIAAPSAPGARSSAPLSSQGQHRRGRQLNGCLANNRRVSFVFCAVASG